MPDDGDIQYKLGQIEAELKSLKESQADALKDIREVRDAVNNARGGWKVLVGVASVTSILTGIIFKVFPFLHQIPK